MLMKGDHYSSPEGHVKVKILDLEPGIPNIVVYEKTTRLNKSITMKKPIEEFIQWLKAFNITKIQGESNE